MSKFHPDLVVYEKGLSSPLFKQIKQRIKKGNPQAEFKDYSPPVPKLPFSIDKSSTRQIRDKQIWKQAKKSLVLRDKSIDPKNGLHFFHPFVSVDGIVEGYSFVISMENECPYDCLYCYLQSSLKEIPVPTIFTNFQDRALLIREIKLCQIAINMYSLKNSQGDCLGRDGKAEVNRLLKVLETSIKSAEIEQSIYDIYKTNIESIKESFQKSKIKMISKYIGDLDNYEYLKTPTKIKFMAGEINDGLAMDHLTASSKYLTEIFGNDTIKKDGGFLQFRTKSNNIENFKGVIHNDNTNISFSVNSIKATREYELNTASLDERLNAAKQLQDWGYMIKINIEPIIKYKDEDKNEYKKTLYSYIYVVDQIKIKLDTNLLSPITLGMLRFGSNITEIIKRRNPSLYKHFQDYMTVELEYEKHRYPEKWRIKIYSELAKHIDKVMPDVGVEISTEPRAIWKKAGL